MTSTKFSISASNRITGKSRTTISKHLKDGKLSGETDSDGNTVIDASELLRVYGDVCDFDKATSKARSPSKTQRSETPIDEVQKPTQLLQEQLSRETVERDKEREQLLAQIAYLQSALDKAMEGHNRATLLLQSRTPEEGDWKPAINAIQKQLAAQKQTAASTQRSLEEQVAKYKTALRHEKNKSFWQRLFG